MIRRATFCVTLLVSAAIAVGTACALGRPDVEEGITYGEGGDVALRLDLVRPTEGDGPFPALVFIHGGGWRGGHRRDFRPFALMAAERGYVAISVSYRLTDEQDDAGNVLHPWPAQIHDCKAAVRWLRANADRYRVDASRIGVAGGSAGGHLALMIGLTDAEDGLEGDGGNAGVSSEVHAVVNIFGPTELLDGSEKSTVGPPLLGRLLGGRPDEVPERYREASPATHVDAGDPPILTLHGDADRIVPVEQARILDAALKKAGVPHEMKIYEGQGHGFRGEAQRDAVERMFSFFDAKLKKKAAAAAGKGRLY